MRRNIKLIFMPYSSFTASPCLEKLKASLGRRFAVRGKQNARLPGAFPRFSKSGPSPALDHTGLCDTLKTKPFEAPMGDYGNNDDLVQGAV